MQLGNVEQVPLAVDVAGAAQRDPVGGDRDTAPDRQCADVRERDQRLRQLRVAVEIRPGLRQRNEGLRRGDHHRLKICITTPLAVLTPMAYSATCRCSRRFTELFSASCASLMPV